MRSASLARRDQAEPGAARAAEQIASRAHRYSATRYNPLPAAVRKARKWRGDKRSEADANKV